jgi:hypothetical protein
VAASWLTGLFLRISFYSGRNLTTKADNGAAAVKANEEAIRHVEAGMKAGEKHEGKK